MTLPFDDSDGLSGAAKRDQLNDLDCIKCGRYFPTFDRLSRHMAARHGTPTPNRDGDVELPPYNGRARASFPERKSRPMAKRKNAPAPTRARRGGGIPAPSKDAGASPDFNPFLKATDIGDENDTAVLTFTGGDVRVVDGNFGEQIIVECKLNGSLYEWGITVDSVNHRMLFDKFGQNPKSWRGKVPVQVKMSRQKRLYIAVQRER